MIPLITGGMLLAFLMLLGVALGRRILLILRIRSESLLEQGALALGLEMLYALLLGLTPDAPPAVGQFALGIVALAGTYLLARRIGGPFVGAAALTLLLLHKGFWEEFAIPYVDLGMAAFATMAALA